MIDVKQNVSLADYSTMGLGGNSAYLVSVSSKEELLEALDFASSKDLKVIMIGQGSNIIWRETDFNGLVIVNNIKEVTFNWQNDIDCIVKIGSGEIWDEVVAKCVDNSLSGIEALSLVPGTVGGTPVQNVGAYGQEIATTLVELEAYDLQAKQFVNLKNEDCSFGYRTSRFKTNDHGRFFITSITLKLTKTNPSPPFYAALAQYLEENSITEFTPRSIREAVITIRSSKLPDPKLVKNTGSFFSNPVITEEKYNSLKETYPEIPGWPDKEGRVKVPAAWLIESIGFKDYHDPETGMATWATQPLVLVNEKASSSQDLFRFRDRIINAVKQKFDITLAQEPELLP